MKVMVSSNAIPLYNTDTMPGFSLVAIILGAVWMSLFIASRATRKEQVIMSFLGLFLSPGALLFAAQDYRAVNIDVVQFTGVPELLFVFSAFGVAAVLHELMPHKKEGTPMPKTRLDTHVSSVFAKLCVVTGAWLFISVAAYAIFRLPSIYACILGGMLVGVYVIADRKDLFTPALISGVFFSILIFLVEQFFFLRLYPDAALGFWHVENLSGILLGGIPAEEILWAATVGFAVGPLYEFVSGKHAR